MKKIAIYISIVLLCIACSTEDAKIDNYTHESKPSANLTEKTVNADLIALRGNNTRALYDYNSSSLTYKRFYEQGDQYFVANPYLTPECYVGDAYMSYGADLNLYDYRPATNDFMNANSMFYPYIYYDIWDADGDGNDDNEYDLLCDSLMFVIIDKNCTDMYWQMHRWNNAYFPYHASNAAAGPNDTCFYLGLESQKGTMKDCFCRQIAWIRYPHKLLDGTHIWGNTNAYYWLVLLFDSTEVASIDTIRMHADDNLTSKLYFKYTGHPSTHPALNNNEGPFAIGCDTIYPIEKGWKHADVYLSFFAGDGGSYTFTNFGFEVGWTDKFGVHHNSTEKINQDNIRPQKKYAAAGNVYKDAMTLTLAHGLQNMYEDEVVEVDKWETQIDSTVIIKKD